MKHVDITIRLHDYGSNDNGSRYRLQCFEETSGNARFESQGESIAATIFYAGSFLVRLLALKLSDGGTDVPRK